MQTRLVILLNLSLDGSIDNLSRCHRSSSSASYTMVGRGPGIGAGMDDNPVTGNIYVTDGGVGSGDVFVRCRDLLWRVPVQWVIAAGQFATSVSGRLPARDSPKVLMSKRPLGATSYPALYNSVCPTVVRKRTLGSPVWIVPCAVLIGNSKISSSLTELTA